MADANQAGNPPRAQRTMYPRTHVRQTPLTPDEVEQARVAERARQTYDPFYITAEQARAIPREELARNAELASRVRSSSEDWPENRMSATDALGPLEGGAGEHSERREIPAADLFTGGPMGGPTKEG